VGCRADVAAHSLFECGEIVFGGEDVAAAAVDAPHERGGRHLAERVDGLLHHLGPFDLVDCHGCCSRV